MALLVASLLPIIPFLLVVAMTLSITSQGCDSFPPSHFRTRLPSYNNLRSKWRQRQVLGHYNLFLTTLAKDP